MQKVGGVGMVGTLRMVETVEKALGMVDTVGTVEKVLGLMERWEHWEERWE